VKGLPSRPIGCPDGSGGRDGTTEIHLRGNQAAHDDDLYGVLPLTAVRWVRPLRRDDDGRHVFPPLDA